MNDPSLFVLKQTKSQDIPYWCFSIYYVTEIQWGTMEEDYNWYD